MAYVAVKGGEQAIENAEALLKYMRRGSGEIPELTLEQIKQQMALAVDRVMCEGSLYDPDLAALAIKQSWGDLIEAIFLLRAYRTTLPRLYHSQSIDTQKMQLQRRISSTFKDVPGGQVLGATFDYVQRLLDFELVANGKQRVAPEVAPQPDNLQERVPRLTELLEQEGLIEECSGSIDRQSDSVATIHDLTRQPLTLPASRETRLQNLARADEGFLLGLAYSTQRGYGNNHPFAGEIRVGKVEVVICPEELGFAVAIADIPVTEVQMINQFKGSAEVPPQFTRGYGLTLGYNERKALSMALVDRSLRAKELDEEMVAPAQDEEFVLLHSDNVEAQGFVQHLKLPHYIDFQSELNLLRSIRQQDQRSEQVSGYAKTIAHSPFESAPLAGSALSKGEQWFSPQHLEEQIEEQIEEQASIAGKENHDSV